jgi:polyhydroxyalkanoate synthase
LTWFEDGARIPAAFLKSYNRDLLLNNSLKEPAGFAVHGVPIDLAAIEAPMLVIALKDDHVSAWEAVYRGARDIGADFILGGSGHNAGVINPPSRNKHGFWTGKARPEAAEDWLAEAERHEGSWWPLWTQWLDARAPAGPVPARKIKAGIEPAPGSYVMMP